MDDFDSVSWRSPPHRHDGSEDTDDSRPPSTSGRDGTDPNGLQFHHAEEPQAGPNADAIDLAGVGQGRLETKVTDPVTENDGTKDAFVSYFVTTNV